MGESKLTKPIHEIIHGPAQPDFPKQRGPGRDVAQQQIARGVELVGKRLEGDGVLDADLAHVCGAGLGRFGRGEEEASEKFCIGLGLGYNCAGALVIDIYSKE